MRVTFITLGCKVNQYETQALKALFEEEGYQLVSEEESADVCIINSCSVTNIADRKSRQAIRKFRRMNPAGIVAVTGCYAQVGTEDLQAMPEVDVIAGTNEKTSLPELIRQYAVEKTQQTRVDEYRDLGRYDEMGIVEAMEGRTRAFIKIQEGCNRFCSYCIIPYARGPVRSRREEDILEEAKSLIGSGYREIVLTGINTALFGSEEDGTPKLDRLIGKLSELPGNFRIRLSSLEPTVINADYVKRLLPYDKLCHHVHLSIQSGSDKVLKDMNRRYDREEYLEIVRTLKEFDPDYGISTDIIVGFPGETEEDFQQTLSLVREVRFDSAFMFKYSERPGTYAARHLPDNVPEEEKIRRLNELIHLQTEISAQRNREDEGKEFEVLVEGFSKRSREQLCGRTEQNKMVVFPKAGHHIGERVIVRITGSTSATLFGEAVTTC